MALLMRPSSLLLHYTGGHTEGLARADGVRDIGLACADDPPNNAPLVGPQGDDIAGTRQLQMASVEMAGDEIVELVVVESAEAVGAVGIGPDPALKGGLDFWSFSFAASVSAAFKTRFSCHPR